MGQEFRQLIALLKDEDNWLPPTDDDIRETERLRAQIEQDIAAGRIRLPESRQTPEEFRTATCAGIVIRRLASLAIDFPEQERELSELATSIGSYSNEPSDENFIRECIRSLSGEIGANDQLDKTIAQVWRLLADQRFHVLANDFPNCVNGLKELYPIFRQLADSAANWPILRRCLELLNQPIKTEEQLYETITRVSEIGATQGIARAQTNLGWYYLQGIGMQEPNPEEAVKWFRKAAQQGMASAQNSLGWCYQQGIGMQEPDPEEAVEWFRKAAEQGDPAAQGNLGLCYRQGIGMKEPNPKKALKWCRKAAEQGDACAQYNLAEWYSCHPTENPNEPIDWYLKAAQQRYAPAEYVLAECYRFGRNVSKDLEQSNDWLQRAQEHGCTWTLPTQLPPVETQRLRMSLSTPEHRLVSQLQEAQFSGVSDDPFAPLETQHKDVR